MNLKSRWAGHVARMEQFRNAYRVLVGKPDDIKMNLREVGCDPGDLIALAEDMDQWRAYVRPVIDLRVP